MSDTTFSCSSRDIQLTLNHAPPSAFHWSKAKIVNADREIVKESGRKSDRSRVDRLSFSLCCAVEGEQSAQRSGKLVGESEITHNRLVQLSNFFFVMKSLLLSFLIGEAQVGVEFGEEVLDSIQDLSVGIVRLTTRFDIVDSKTE